MQSVSIRSRLSLSLTTLCGKKMKSVTPHPISRLATITVRVQTEIEVWDLNIISGHSQRARLVISHDQISGKFVLIDWWQNILQDWWHIRKSIAGSVCVFTFNEPTCILNVITVFIVFTRTHTRIHMDTHEQRGTSTDTHMLTRELNVWHGHVGPTLYRYSNYYDSSI